MKIELPLMPPKDVKEAWEGQFSVFSWYNFVINAPSAVFIVTTRKENGRANAQLNAWGMMIGSGKEPKFLLQVMLNSDTHRLIKKNKEFVINYPSLRLREKFLKTITHFENEIDELIASGLTHEEPKVVQVPRVKECFASLECKLDWVQAVESEEKVTALIQGSIVNAAIDEAVLADDMKESYIKRNFACLLPEVINPVTAISLGYSGLVSLDMESCVEC